MTYRVAVIGAGNLGQIHVRNWMKLKDVAVVGMSASSKSEAEGLAQTAGCPAFGEGEFDDMLAATKPDIVDICVPTRWHRSYVELASARKVAIFLETPLALTAADCQAIVDAVEEHGVKCMAGGAGRFCPEFRNAADEVFVGGVGNPGVIRVSRMTGPRTDSPSNWLMDQTQSGGVVLDFMVRDFEWLLHTFGPATRIYAKGARGPAEAAGLIDYALATIRFATGAVAHVTGSWAHAAGTVQTTLEIAGDRGLIEYDSARHKPFTISTSVDAGSVSGLQESPLNDQDDPCFLQLEAFVRCLSENSPIPVTLAEARDATLMALAALESIQTGRVITLQ
jgi:predicted dehydrogenase